MADNKDIGLNSKQENKDEFVCKIKTRKKEIDLTDYRFYDKRVGTRFIKFCHRVASNVFLKLYLKMFHGVKVIGRHNAQNLKKKGVVVVSNHIHPLDIQMVSMFLFDMRPVHYLTLKKNFDLWVSGFIKNSGGVPIPEDHESKKKCFNQMNDLLSDGGVLYLCPEGSLVELCNEIRPFKDGAFRFAYENNVPILPVTIRFKSTNKNGRKYKFPKFVIDVSQPIYPDVSQASLKEETSKVMHSRCNTTIKDKT